MHHFFRASDIRPVPAFAAESSAYRCFSLSDRDCGAVHSGWGLAELDAKGYLNQHLQSFEKSFYVLEGNPVLVLDNRAWRLEPGACGLIPVGMKQAWLGPESGTARWIDMNTPVPKGVNFADDTYFLGPPPDVPIGALDIRDPTSRHLFRMADDDIKIDALRTGRRIVRITHLL
jgi:quercetin dioxygenase-like cupin family protein